MVYSVLSAFCLAAALFVLSLGFSFSNAKYVTEIGGGNLDYETQMPAEVGSQQDLFNAITSGYGYVKLSDKLEGPIIMTGDSLDLKNDLTIDLNDNEIERNSRDSLLRIPSGKTLTIVDTGKAAKGGLYNPIGSVLTVKGGKLNVYGGKFESGPRPTEYYGNLTQAERNAITVHTVHMLNKDGSDSGTTADMPILPIRDALSAAPKSGNVYFDVDYVAGGKTLIRRDTYCYLAVSGETGDSFATFDVSKADFAYTYNLTADGSAYTETESEDTLKVMVFGYEDDIAASMALTATNPDTGEKEAPGYAAVSMQGGVMNVNVTAVASASRDVIGGGSFFSYFGTWHTYCILMNGGEMNVSTSGKFATVNPSDLPALVQGVETRENSAKYGENACIMCAKGTLNINKIALAEAYNGSVISVSGGTVNMRDTVITKDATLSHADSPFSIADITMPDGASEFPEGRQYRDAALFINGGTLNLSNTAVTVNKNIKEYYPLEAGQAVRPKTTFGILSRGRSAAAVSSLVGNDVTFDLHGPQSFGVFATRGKVELRGGSITLDSDNASYGVYAVNKVADIERAANIRLKDCNIWLGDEVTYEGKDASDKPILPQGSNWVDANGNSVAAGSVGAMRVASVGVYLDSSEYPNGSVTLDNSEIHSQEMGVAVDNGTLTFENRGIIHAYNSSAVGLRGGDILFNNKADGSIAEYEIRCYLNRMGLDSEQCMAFDPVATTATKHQYDIYLPWQVKADGTIGNAYENTNAIRVIGGTLTAEGKLDIEFRGLYNDYDMYKTNGDDKIYFDNLLIKSFAVACTQENGKDANIRIKRTDIRSLVGGGIKVQGGNIVLGDEQSTADDIVVHTLGHVHYKDDKLVGESFGNNNYLGWRFYPNLSGGHAVIAREGNITVYNGKYTADFCNGISATGDGTSVIVHNGIFTGNMKHDDGKTHTYMTNSGPASHYGMMVMGAASVRVYGGTFDGKNGGAFIRGATAAKTADVNVYTGKFGHSGGQDGVVVSDYSTVRFGAYSKTDLRDESKVGENKLGEDEDWSPKLQNLITVRGNLYPISVNYLEKGVEKTDSSTKYNPNNVSISVYYGHYEIGTPGPTRGIGHIDGEMHTVSFHIYGFGKNVFEQNCQHIDGWIRVLADGVNINTGCTQTEQYYSLG